MSAFQFDSSQYPAAIRELIETATPGVIGAGAANAAAHGALQQLDIDAVFDNIADRQMAAACHSGLWLAHGYLDESHTISQAIETCTGSFWHGIMHRREGDFSNAKYWFRNTGAHPVLEALGADVEELIDGEMPGCEPLVDGAGEFDPYALIDWCEASTRGNSTHDEALSCLLTIEWQRLFDYCYQRA